MENKKDMHSERALLATICQYGIDAYGEVDYVTNECFQDQQNAMLFDMLKKIVETGAKPDISLILSEANSMGFGAFFERPEEIGYLRSLFNLPVKLDNVGHYAVKLKKIQVLDKLKKITATIKKDLEGLSGEESIEEILGVAEKPISEILNSAYGVENEEPQMLFEDMENYIYELMQEDSKYKPLKTGNDAYDEAIGGGLRRGGVDVVAARPKAQPLSSKILTPTGWKLMGDIRIGDLICDPNGDYSIVEEIHNHGVRKVFKFVFSDGTECLATEDHLWKIKYRRHKDWKVASYNDIKNSGLYESDRPKWQMPLTKAVHFHSKDHIIHPYVMGVLLGDGCLSKGPCFSNVNDFIKEKVSSLIPQEYTITNHGSKGAKYISKTIKNSNKNIILEELKRLNLNNKLSNQKFIPEEYLFDSVENRTNLLTGLLDTDGSMSSNIIEYSTTSEKLKNDIIFLVRSLGGKCKWAKRKTSCDKIKFFDSFRLYISFNDNTLFFTKPDKLERAKKRSKPELKRNLLSVEYVGEEECRCITVSSNNSLYITDDFIVTHNCGKSSEGLQLGLNLAERGIPVLIVDTEMQIGGQKNRAIANRSMVNVNEITSGEIKKKQEKFKKVISVAQKEKNLPIYHINVSGRDFKTILAIIRKWIAKRVGRDETGRLNDCLIIYDYLKLTTSDDISKNMQEYQVLGFQMTELYNFMVRHDCACRAFVQLNREMDISQSDRIRWLCTSLTTFELKSDEEMADDIEAGVNPPYNRKMRVDCCRFGPGHEFGNYINIRMRGQFARIDAGPTRDELRQQNTIETPDISASGTGSDTSRIDGG